MYSRILLLITSSCLHQSSQEAVRCLEGIQHDHAACDPPCFHQRNIRSTGRFDLCSHVILMPVANVDGGTVGVNSPRTSRTKFYVHEDAIQEYLKCLIEHKDGSDVKAREIVRKWKDFPSITGFFSRVTQARKTR